MTKNTTIALTVINAALFAFIMIYERGTLSTTETSERSGQVLSAFVRDQVERVELAAGEEPPIVFVRERNEDEEDGVLDLGTWRIAEPMATEADDDAVDSLLGALEWLTPTRTLNDITAEDRAQFGLDAPRYTVRFTVREQQVEVVFGGEAPAGGGLYAAVAGEDRAYVVSDDILEELGHDLAHFRSKELFAGFHATGSRRLELRGGGEPVVLQREAEGRWQLGGPEVGWARMGMVDGLLRVLRQAEATRFVAEAGADLDEYGLDAPWRELRAERAEDIDENRVARLRVGELCGEHTDERYAIAGDEGPVVCVPVGDLDGLEVDRTALHEDRLLPVSNDAIEKLVLLRGDGRFELRREEGDWQLFTGPASDPGEPQAASADAIAEWTAQLREARAQAFEGFEGEPGHGVGDPSARLTVQRSDREETLTIRLGDAGAEGTWVRRGDEGALVRFAPEAAALFDVGGSRFRARELLSDVQASQVRRVTRREGTRTEAAQKEPDGSWAMTAPFEQDADRVTLSALTEALAGLTAARIVADEASREHGLSSPELVLEAELTAEEGAAAPEAEPRTVTLQVGAVTDGGRFARLGTSGLVFVLDARSLEALRAPLVSRDLLSLPLEEMSGLRLERAGETHELVADGTGWALAAGGAPDEARTRALIDRLGTLRATEVLSYGPAQRELPTRVVATAREGGATTTLSIGAPEGEGAAAIVPVRVSGVDVTYGVRPDLLTAIVEYTP